MPFLITVEDSSLFKDEEFPHTLNSIGDALAKEAKWIAARRFNEDEFDLFNGISSTDLLQDSSIDNAWVISALAALAEYPKEIQAMFVKNGHRLKGLPGDGHYVIRLFDYKTDDFVYLDIDEYIPYFPDEGKPCFAKPKDNKLWVLILEKAMAKLFGSYSNLIGGNCALAFRALTGEREARLWARTEVEDEWKQSQLVHQDVTFATVTEEGSVSKGDDFFQTLREYAKNNYMMGASLDDTGEASNKTLENGLVTSHTYSFMHVVEIEGSRLIKLRNTWGDQTEWNGAWSDNHAMWDQYPEVKRQLRPVYGNDGIFWMAWEDFKQTFDHVYVSHRNIAGKTREEGISVSATEQKAIEDNIRNLFETTADTNHDGYLDAEELGTLMKALGMNSKNVKQLLNAADTDKDDRLCIQEFLTWVFGGSATADKIVDSLNVKTSATAVKTRMTGARKKGKKKDPKTFGTAATEDGQLQVIFEPGPLGLKMSWDSGVVNKVQDGAQGDRLGVRVGMCYHLINGYGYTEERLRRAQKGKANYEVVFEAGDGEAEAAEDGEQAGEDGAAAGDPSDKKKPSKQQVVLSAPDKAQALKEVRHLFGFCADTNHDGFLDLEELAVLMEELGMDRSNASRLAKAADKNSDGRLDTQELLAWIFSGTDASNKALQVAVEKGKQRTSMT